MKLHQNLLKLIYYLYNLSTKMIKMKKNNSFKPLKIKFHILKNKLNEKIKNIKTNRQKIKNIKILCKIF